MKVVEVAVALLEREGRWFLQRRDPSGPILPGLWEFPGGKVEDGEEPEAACRRELAEEVGLVPTEIIPIGSWTHTYPERRVVLRAFRVRAQGEPRTGLAWGWFTMAELRSLPLPPANAELIRALG